MTAMLDRVEQMYDLLVAHPGGVTFGDLAADQEVSDYMTRLVLHNLRLALGEGEGDGEGINVVCLREPGGRYRYQLVGTVDDAQPWQQTRRRDLRARAETSLAVAKSMFAGTAPSTPERRAARTIVRTLARLVEDIDEFPDSDSAAP